MSHFSNNSIFSTFCFIIASLVLFQNKFGFISQIIWHSYFGAILIPKKTYYIEIYNIEIHNVMLQSGGEWLVLTL